MVQFYDRGYIDGAELSWYLIDQVQRWKLCHIWLGKEWKMDKFSAGYNPIWAKFMTGYHLTGENVL